MVKIDVNREIRRAVDTGKVIFGVRKTEKSILKGDGQLVILSRNAPKLVSERIIAISKSSGVPSYTHKLSGLELGSVCGKPFVVSAMLIKNPGKSKVMKIVEGSK